MPVKTVKPLLHSASLVIALLLFHGSFAQYTIQQDPQNPKRKIIRYNKILRTTPVQRPTRNVLQEAKVQRPAIRYRPFEMVNPRTNKPIDPNKAMNIKLKNGQTRTINAKQFFDELNALESELAKHGRSLRIPATFHDLRREPDNNQFRVRKPILTKNFTSGTINVSKTPLPKTNLPRTSILRQVTVSHFSRATSGSNMIIGKNTIGNSGSGNTGGVINVGNVGVNPGTIIFAAPETSLFVAARFEDHGQPEFPAQWVKSSWSGKGRDVFPVLVQVLSSQAPLIKKIEWQASRKPFDKTLKDANVPNIEFRGTVGPPEWRDIYRGVTELPNFKNYKYAPLYPDLSAFPEPDKTIVPFFIRAVSFDAAGEVIDISDQVVANYGSNPEDTEFKIAPVTYNTVPGFNYQFPDIDNLPFGVFVKGSGLSTVKTTEYKNKDYKNLLNKGYKIAASASLGVKYFNFLSLVDPNTPMASDLVLIKGQFAAIAGRGTGPGNTDETNGITLNLSFLNDNVKYPAIDFTTPVSPGIPDIISLEYDVKQEIDVPLLDMWMLIGPVPIHIAAGISGEAGIRLFGQVNKNNFDVSGGIKPFINTRFDATGGVDALIAYATLNAEVNPLLSIEMPLSFSSTGSKPVSFNTNVSGLSGRIFLKIGFWYPCPDLEKIVGWLTGDEETPLCECVWEYNIFDFPGFTHSYGY